MSSRFFDSFPLTNGAALSPSASLVTMEQLMDGAGGRTFADGLYRVHTRESALAANALIRDAFPEYAGRVAAFGYDWLGRQFATDTNRGPSEDLEILLLEPGTGEALEIPVRFSEFHDGELVDQLEAALARSFFLEWRRLGGAAPTASECVGYIRPLFLGGKDTVENLEVSDLDVYWTIMGQLRRRTKGM